MRTRDNANKYPSHTDAKRGAYSTNISLGFFLQGGFRSLPSACVFFLRGGLLSRGRIHTFAVSRASAFAKSSAVAASQASRMEPPRCKTCSPASPANSRSASVVKGRGCLNLTGLATGFGTSVTGSRHGGGVGGLAPIHSRGGRLEEEAAWSLEETIPRLRNAK